VDAGQGHLDEPRKILVAQGSQFQPRSHEAQPKQGPNVIEIHRPTIRARRRTLRAGDVTLDDRLPDQLALVEAGSQLPPTVEGSDHDVANVPKPLPLVEAP
jgi:hypothetical protein